MKLSRLIQPRNPQFWLLVVLNALSTAITYIVRSYDLPLLVMLILVVFALGNFLLGLKIALALMADKP